MEISQLVLEPLRTDEEFVLYRGAQAEPPGSPSVLLLAPASERPPQETLKKIEHEYSLRDELDSSWAVRPLTLAEHRGGLALVLEDPGGEILDRFLSGPMEMTQFLRFAVALATALRGLHESELIHKDVKPSNVLINAATGLVRLMGFGIASRLVRERQSPDPPEFIAGTLPYMAPEQTGRMNRSIDSRSDLYALGVTLYEMLTGNLPFATSDLMELMHCHIARQPIPPSERLKGIPGAVSAIIMKLLAKTAEERYQTASGAARDLRHCLAEWETRGWIDEFRLGEQDIPDRLLIPEKLYGRAPEIETLLASFDRVVAGGKPELVLVSGYSGIGKSSVVNELHKSLVMPRGLFASGKFDQYKRDIPYATLAQAFQSLIRPLFSKNERELSEWRDALLDALGPNGKLIVNLVPELQLIVGEPQPVPDLLQQDAQRRFQFVFRRFIGVFARPEHPLALFLDDLQWLDSATLDLIEDLLSQPDVRHLMLIGAYRNNEVNSSHPLMRKLDAIRKAGAPVQEIVLGPLASEDLAQLIADALHCDPERATALAGLIHEKTAGNPFFAIQFVSALVEEGLLTFDHREGRWSWDLNNIRGKGYSDNVVDLLIGKLSRLPIKTQQALQLLACMGNSAEFTLLQMVSQQSNDEMRARLWDAIRVGLIFLTENSYKFVHDRVQEAAYSLIPEELKAHAHLRIGRLLAAETPSAKREEKIFEIVNQLNRGAALITSKEEREQLAEYNLVAGRRAKDSTAYSSALKYLTTGTALLRNDAWKRRHELIFPMELNRAECEFLSGQLAPAEARLTMLSSRAADSVELSAVTCLRADLYMTVDRDRAVAVCLDYLRHVGVEWSPHPSEEETRREYERIWTQLGDREIKDLICLPLMTNPASLGTMDVLTKLAVPAWFTDANLGALVLFRAVNLSMEHGNSDASCFFYVERAVAEGLMRFRKIAGPHFKNYKAGFEFGRLGYDLVEKRGLRRFKARTYLAFGKVVMPWISHIRNGRDLVRGAFDAANEVGDLTFAALSCNQLNANLLAVGDPLGEVQHEAEKGLAFARKARFGLVVDAIIPQLQLVRTLRGLTPKFGSFSDEDFDELEFEGHLERSPALGPSEFSYWVLKLQARFFAMDYASCIDAAMRAQRLLGIAMSYFDAAEYHFYSALSKAALWDSATPVEAQQYRGGLTNHHEQLELWRENCPENFENRAAVLAAEIARIEGRDLDAMRLYEQAIHSAHANGFINNEAIAYEVAARFYAARGFEKIADAYFLEARFAYVRWGADGKVRQLDQQHPQLRHEKSVSSRSMIAASVEQLDLATVIKVSQAVSGEMVLEKLIDRLMRTAIEHAGAERGLLLVPRGDELQIEAAATTSGEDVTVYLRDSAHTADTLPESLVRYVMRTREVVILDDAASQNAFSADPYIVQRRPRSILSLPLISQGKLSGILYLENNLTPHVFTSDRVTVLKVLASQAAISLENTRLYRDLEDREARIRRLVDANILGIFIWDFEGAIVEANEAFLHMLQYGHEDVASGRVRWTDLTAPEWREQDERALAELKATGMVRPYEKEYFRKDGSRVPVLVAGAVFEEGGGEGVAFALDLSEQKRAEDALRRSESYLAEAQRLSQTGSWVWSPEQGIRYWSEECYRVLSFDPQDGLPRFEDFFQRLHPDDQPGFRELIQTAIREKAEWEADYRIMHPDGPVRDIHVVGHPVLSTSGDLVEFVGTVIDVTERKRAEQERERLRQLEAEMAHINRVSMLGEMAASLAHEIKQPIAAAITSANTCIEWLAHEPPNIERARASAIKVDKYGNRAAEIIDRIRSLYKKAPPQREFVDVNGIIQEMLTLLKGEADRYPIAMRAELASDLPKIMADRVQLQQVFMNLMLNAIEAMKDSGGELTVKSQLQNGQLRFSVSDTGLGLPAGSVEQIFSAFYTTKPQGSGMGLAISRSIVESHGGRMWATANNGRGATFHFTLPLAAEVVQKVHHPSATQGCS